MVVFSNSEFMHLRDITDDLKNNNFLFKRYNWYWFGDLFVYFLGISNLFIFK